jgi:uncharacterized protein (DUF302 family)
LEGFAMTTNISASDLIEHVSPIGFAPTLDRLTRAIEAAGLQVFTSIDHAAAARTVGMTMPATVVLLYGNPKGGTPVMLTTPSAALDLPLRVLVREDATGRTIVAFHPVRSMLGRAGVPDEFAKRMEPAQRLLVDAIASWAAHIPD